MHGLYTEHTAGDKLSEHSADMVSENESDLSEESNTTEMVHDFNELKFETKTTEQEPDKEGTMKKKVLPLEKRLNS